MTGGTGEACAGCERDASRRTPRGEGAAVKVSGAYWQELSVEEGVLVPAGGLAAGEGELLFRAHPEFATLEREMEGKIAEMLGTGLTPNQVVDYYRALSNGISFAVSGPVHVEAASVEDAAEELLARSKSHG
jgi:hypothetical protein